LLVKRFLIADDSEIARRVLRDLLTRNPEWLVCAEAVDGLKAVEMAAITQPEFVILDLQMPRLHGIEAARQIIALFASIPVLMISSHDPDLVMAELKSTQIRGFLSKTNLDRELFLAIEAILAGGTYFPRSKPPDDVQQNPGGAEAGN
jgi:DNA-binding NarL/FixJ family response regulator